MRVARALEALPETAVQIETICAGYRQAKLGGGCSEHELAAAAHRARRLHAHHIVHWANGGPTELPNLVLVCNFHHHLLHEHGWSIEANSQGGHRWVTPSGETATIKVFRGRHSVLAGEHTDPDIQQCSGSFAVIAPR